MTWLLVIRHHHSRRTSCCRRCAAPSSPAPSSPLYKKMLPAMSQTEREALEAGTVWWEGELFSGKPDWQKLLAYPQPKLTAEEQSFLDNECEELCRLTRRLGHHARSTTTCRRKPGPTSRTRASSA
jgi:hypothetical protein